MMTFTSEQLATLRKIAQQATQGEWRAFISSGTDTYAVYTPGYDRCDDIIKWPGFDGQKNAANNARYIAAFNPKVVLALLDVLDASLEAEPVAYMWDSERKDIDAPGYYRTEHLVFAESSVKQWGGRVVPLYTAPPAPVVPKAEPVAWTDREELRDVERHGLGEIFQYPPDKYADLRRVIPLYREPPAPVVPKAAPIAVSDDMAYAFHHALSDSSPGADEVEEIKTGLRAAFANVTVQPVLIVPDEIEPDDSNTFDYVDGWNACRAVMLQGKGGA